MNRGWGQQKYPKYWCLLPKASVNSDRESLIKRRRISTVDLLVVRSSDQLILILKNEYFYILQNQLSWWGGKAYWALPFVKDSLIIVLLLWSQGAKVNAIEEFCWLGVANVNLANTYHYWYVGMLWMTFWGYLWL